MSQKTVDVLLGEIREAAVLPEMGAGLVQTLSNPDVGFEELTRVFREDFALATNLLKIANSAFYGFSRQIDSTERAIVLLGVNAVKALAFACSVRSAFTAGVEIGHVWARRLWLHSLATGVIARRVFRKAGLPNDEGAFLAGVIHDMGLLLENQCRPELFVEVVEAASGADVPFRELEQHLLDTDQCELGQAAARQWRLPPHLVDVVACHHTPMEADEGARVLVCAVALAEHLSAQAPLDFGDLTPADTLDPWVWDVLKLEPNEVQALPEVVEEQTRALRSILAM